MWHLSGHVSFTVEFLGWHLCVVMYKPYLKLWHWCPSVWGVLLLFLATALYIEGCFENHCCRFEFIWLQLLICLCFNESDCVFVFLSCLLCLWVDRLLYQLGCYFRLFFSPCIGVFVCMEHLQIQFAISHRAPLHSAGSTTINARVDNQAPRLVSLRSKANDIHSSLSIPIYLISLSLYLVVSCLTLWCFNLVFPLLKLIRLLVF